MADGLDAIMDEFRKLDPFIPTTLRALDLLPFSENVLLNPDKTRSIAAHQAQFGATAPHKKKKKPRTEVHRGTNGIVSTMHIH